MYDDDARDPINYESGGWTFESFRARHFGTHSLWVVNSNATRPEIMQPFCRDHGARYVTLSVVQELRPTPVRPRTSERKNIRVTVRRGQQFRFGRRIEGGCRRSPAGSIARPLAFGSMGLRRSMPGKSTYDRIPS